MVCATAAAARCTNAKKGLLVHVECGDTPEETFARTLAALKVEA